MPRKKPSWRKEQIPGQRSITDVFQKAIEKEGEKKKNEEDDERRKEKDEGKTPPEVITIHSSSASDDAKRMDDSESSPLGGPKPTHVDSVKETPFAKGEETKTVGGEDKTRREKRKKGGFGAPPPTTTTTTNEETTYAPSPDSAEKKRGEDSKKPKGYADAVERNLANEEDEEDAVERNFQMMEINKDWEPWQEELRLEMVEFAKEQKPIISELRKKQYALEKYIAGDGKKNSQIKDVVKFAKEEKTRIL